MSKNTCCVIVLSDRFGLKSPSVSLAMWLRLCGARKKNRAIFFRSNACNLLFCVRKHSRRQTICEKNDFYLCYDRLTGHSHLTMGLIDAFFVRMKNRFQLLQQSRISWRKCYEATLTLLYSQIAIETTWTP